VRVRHAPERRRHREPRLREQRLHQPLGEREHVVLLDERRLDVDLGELGLPVGPQVLVAEAAGDLEVAVVPGDHEELLVDLRTLRERVELARVHAARHEVVARALGRGLRQDRRLELEEALAAQERARGLEQPVAQHEVALQLGAPQVEVAVAEAQLLGRQLVVGAARDGDRGGAAGPTTRSPVTRTSTSPVSMSALRISPGRSATSPSASTTLSIPTAAAAAITAAGVQRGSNESWTIPSRSRRSMKTRAPRSRLRCTHPPSVTRAPACSARREPQACERRVVGGVGGDARDGSGAGAVVT
jgi:hypothetical protein